MDLTPLREELSKPEYQGKSEEECVELINAKTVVVRRPVPVRKLKRGMIGAGIYAELKIAASDSLQPLAVKKAAINALGLIDSYEGSAIDLDSELAREILHDLVDAQFCTRDAVDQLLEQVNQTVPWAKAVGLGTVGIGFVTLARKG